MNPALMVKGGAEVMRYLSSYLKSKPLILENGERIIRHTGYLEPGRAFLTYSKELVLDDPGPGGVVEIVP